MRKLNLGCGNNVLDGWENYDLNPVDERVNHLDLRKKFPFKDDSVDKICLFGVLEHFPKDVQIHIMKECHRVLNPGGELIVRLPSFAPYLTHYSTDHWDDYLLPFCKDSPINEYISDKLFDFVSVKGVTIFRTWLWRFKKHICRLFRSHYVFRLRKER